MLENWQNEVTEKLENGSKRMDSIEKNLKANTDATNAMASDMALIRDVLQTCKAGFKVLAGIGAIARWLAPILTVIGLFWALVHGKFPNDQLKG